MESSKRLRKNLKSDVNVFFKYNTNSNNCCVFSSCPDCLEEGTESNQQCPPIALLDLSYTMV